MRRNKQTRFDKSSVFFLHFLQTPKLGNSGYDCQTYISANLEMFVVQLQESTRLERYNQFVLRWLQNLGQRDC